ncbi:MAG: hypothetical protein QW291_04790 [Thermofilaceae archaeon]
MRVMDYTRAVLVAHGDLDGLASAAIIIAALRRMKGLRIELLIAQPYNLYIKLAELAAMPPNLLLITDLGIDEATWSSTINATTKLISEGCRILWIDHHVSTSRLALELLMRGVSILYTSNGSTSTLTREVFVPLTENPEFFAKLAKIGEIADGVIADDELTVVADRVAAALSAPSAKEQFKRKLVKMWVDEQKLIDDEVAIKAEEFEKLLAHKMAHVKEKIVVDLEKGLIIDAREIKLGGLAGHIASRIAREKKKVTVVIFSPNNRETVATCRVPHMIEFNALQELSSVVSKLGGGGGGLSKAAAVRVPREMGDLLLHSIYELFRTKLN